MQVYCLGLVDYPTCAALQETLRRRVQQQGDAAEAVLLCEHPPVLTLGKRATEADLVVDPARLSALGIAVHPSNRGGQATYHGPGQLVVYPVVRLRRGVLAHIEALAGAVVELAASLQVAARFDRTHVGVWVQDKKLAAIGVQVSRRVAIHGLALNLTAEATQVFGRGLFVPCGDPRGRATSLAESLPLGSTLPPLATLVERLSAALLTRLDRPPCSPIFTDVELLSRHLSVQ